MKKTELNINKLISETETLLSDGKIEGAAQGERIIQIIEYENGSKYRLSVVATLITD